MIALGQPYVVHASRTKATPEPTLPFECSFPVGMAPVGPDGPLTHVGWRAFCPGERVVIRSIMQTSLTEVVVRGLAYSNRARLLQLWPVYAPVEGKSI